MPVKKMEYILPNGGEFNADESRGRIRKKINLNKSKNKKGPLKKIKATSHEMLVGFKRAS